MESILGQAALAYAERGLALFPCKRHEKRPDGNLVAHGLTEATVDTEQVRAWWKAEPEANIALVTGLTFDALDIDGPGSMAAFDAAMPLAECEGDDPVVIGPTVATPRGWHVYVAPTGLRNTVKLGGIIGVDWRGMGGYVIVPPSVKADGSAWSWMRPDDPVFGPEAPIVPAPTWLLELRQQVPPPAVGDSARRPSDAYGRRALESEVGRVVMATVGERNHQLNRSAHALGQLVGARALELATVISALEDVGNRSGLDSREVRATVRSGLAAGMRDPRRMPR